MSVLSVSCAGGRRPAVIGPVPDPARVAEALERETPLEEPLQINFRWRLNEDRQRHGGIGVARVEPPYRARLDLFTDDLESVVTAVLVDGSLVLPPGSRDDILPPVDLMWATLGVFRPHDARLVDGQLLEGGATRLRYAYPDGSELHYQIQEGALRSVELVREGRVAQWVELTLEAGSRYPAEAKYRNLPAYRELTIVREELAVVAPFDPEIWDPV